MAILDLDLAVMSDDNHAPPPPPEAAADHELHRLGKPSDDDGGGDDGVLTKGVRHLCERGITALPGRYVLPPGDRPGARLAIRLPVVDLARLRSGLGAADRAAALAELDAACRDYGIFQVVNHGVDGGGAALDVARRFFEELPAAERARYMSPDIRAPVRCGTSFNQLNDGVLCWRDFLKLAVSHSPAAGLAAVLPSWPDTPSDLREVVSAYARACHRLFKELMEAALEALLGGSAGGEVLESCEVGSQMLMVNCFPACPEPELTLGMPPHSDYGFLTVLLQDQVNGLEVRHADAWLLVDPLPGSLLVNIGDHLEIYSNGRYKSVLHRVRVNSGRSRISVASLHSLPPERVIGPAPELVDEERGKPRRYMDTDFATFLSYLASAEGKHKTFLQSRRIPQEDEELIQASNPSL
ncbi:hypothetical protein ACP70R_007353 [Stipagrostis hirtigluma subsp. patula]